MNKELTTNGVEKSVEELRQLVNRISIDLGRSRIRMHDGADYYRIFDSEYMQIDNNAQLRPDAKDIYGDFIIESCPRSSIVGNRYVKGHTMKYHKGVEYQADNDDLKADQDETYINTAYAIATDILKRGKHNSKIKLGICIPTAEFFSDNRDIIKDRLAGTYKIKFPLCDKVIIFQLIKSNILVTPEGVIAVAPLYSKPDFNKIVRTLKGVIVDVGYGSTDVTILDKGQPQGNGARSFPIGGCSLEALVADTLEKKGYGDSKGNVKQAIETGTVQNGEETKDVGILVEEAKNILAQKIVEGIKTILQKSFVQVSEISYMVTIGRNFIIGGKESTESYTGSLSALVGVTHWPTKIKLFSPQPVLTEKIGEDKKPVKDESGKSVMVPRVTEDGVEVCAMEVANVLGVALANRAA